MTEQKKVKVYSTEMCPYCHMAKDFLREHKIKFEDIRVDEDQLAAIEMMKKSGQTGVPVIEIGKEIIIGFDQARIKKALGLK